MSKMKYINFEHIGIVIFGSIIDHGTMQQLVGHKALSAGFCSLPAKDSLGNVPHCYGKSVSLKLEATEEDTQLLQTLMRSNEWDF